MKFLSAFIIMLGAILMIAYAAHHSKNKPVARVHSSWENRNWYAIGDSITYANQYQPIVKTALAMQSVKTDAIRGQSMKTMANRLTKEKLKNIDLITVFGGTNDYGRNTPLGTPQDRPEAATFYGYVKKTIGKINADKPGDAVVVFITPLKRGSYKKEPVYPQANRAGAKLEDYVTAIQTECEANSIPVIDLFHHSGLELRNISKYTKDNLHPNAAGYRKLSKVVISELNKIPPIGESEARKQRSS